MAYIRSNLQRKENRGPQNPQSALQCLQKGDQRLLVRDVQVQAEGMTLNGAGAKVKALRHVTGFQPRGVEPFFQRLCLTGMAECVAEPNAFERRHFVEPGASTSFERQVRIGFDLS